MLRFRASRRALLYLLFLFLCFVALKPGLLILDGLAYYSYLPSLFLDQDLNFWNEFYAGGVFSGSTPSGRGVTSAGYVSNHWSIGPATLWWPFWLLGHFLTRALYHVPGPDWPLNGFSVYYNIGVRFATALFGFVTLVLCYNAFRALISKYLLTAVLLVAIGTPFYWYTFLNADTSHVPAAFAIAFFVVLWLIRRRAGATAWYAIGFGLCGGLATLIRIQDALVFLFIPMVWVSEWRSGRSTVSAILKEGSVIAVASLFVFGLQFMVWKILFGNFLGPLQARVPLENASNFYFLFTGRIYAYEVLFSSYHGLFFFTPLLFFCIAGWFAGLRSQNKKDISIVSLIILGLQLLLMFNERWFWEGTSFGMRRLVDWTPLFIFGLASLMESIPRAWIRVAAAVSAVWCLLLQWTYSVRPMSVLFDYQPPSIIFQWMIDTISNTPAHFAEIFTPNAPAGLLFIALLFFGTLAYLPFTGILRFVRALEAGDRRIMVCGFLIVAGMVCVMYGLTARAAANGDRSKAAYAKELRWLADRTTSSYANGIAEHVFSEAKFLAQFKGWEEATDSFRECLTLSPEPERMRQRIASFVRKGLPEAEAHAYLAALGN